MAFNIANRSSLRLNHILVGQLVTLVDFQSKKVLHENAAFRGWSLDGNDVEAPKVIKSAPQNIEMVFDAIVDLDKPLTGDNLQNVILVKDPAGFGAMFLKTVKGEGDDQKVTLRRVTAYATEETIQRSKAVRNPPKAEKVEAAPEETEAQPEA